MPAPDIQYFLDGALECGDIAGDTHFYFMHLEPRANAIIDGFDDRRGAVDDWSSALAQSGEWCEDHYLAFRASHRDQRELCSFNAALGFRYQFREYVNTLAGRLVEAKANGPSARALAEVNSRRRLDHSGKVLRRALTRINHDLGSLGPGALRDLAAETERYFQMRRLDHEEALAAARQSVQEPITKNRKERGILKRSIKIAERLIGSKKTRIFIGGGRIRFEGRHAVYEMHKTVSVLGGGHGGSTLSVYDKDGIERLCDLCIYTPQVPVLDHVASIALHIQAGNEEEILTIGNAYNIGPNAYAHDWLVPHLPNRGGFYVDAEQAFTDRVDILAFFNRMGPDMTKVVPMRRKIYRRLVTDLGDLLPLVSRVQAASDGLRLLG